MYFSQFLTFSENQAITATAISEDVLEFPDNDTIPGEAAAYPRDLGLREIPIVVQVTETFATLTSLTVTLESSAAAGLTSATTHWTSGAIPVASLIAGYEFKIPHIPRGTMLKYLGLRYTVGGSNATAGKITATIAGD